MSAVRRRGESGSRARLLAARAEFSAQDARYKAALANGDDSAAATICLRRRRAIERLTEAQATADSLGQGR